MERSKAGMEKEVPTAHHVQIMTILIRIIWYYFARCGKNAMKFNWQKIKWI